MIENINLFIGLLLLFTCIMNFYMISELNKIQRSQNFINETQRIVFEMFKKKSEDRTTPKQ